MKKVKIILSMMLIVAMMITVLNPLMVMASEKPDSYGSNIGKEKMVVFDGERNYKISMSELSHNPVEIISEKFYIESQEYILEREISDTQIKATVYKDGIIESQAISDKIASDTQYIYPREISTQEIRAVVKVASSTPNYRLVSTSERSLRFASLTLTGVVAAIGAACGGVGAAVILALAKEIVADGLKECKYILETWTANDGTYFYQKSVFRFYNKETGKKVGSDITTTTKTRIK